MFFLLPRCSHWAFRLFILSFCSFLYSCLKVKRRKNVYSFVPVASSTHDFFLTSVRPSFRSFVCSFAHSFVPSFFPSFVLSFLCSLAYSLLRSPVYSLVFILSINHFLVRLCVFSFMRSLVCPLISSLVHLFVPSIYSFVCSFIYSSFGLVMRLFFLRLLLFFVS